MELTAISIIAESTVSYDHNSTVIVTYNNQDEPVHSELINQDISTTLQRATSCANIMPSTRLGERYKPSRSSQKGFRNDFGRSQSVAEGQGSVNEAQTDKLCHSEADNNVLPSKRAEIATRSLSGHIQIQPEGIKQRISAERVSNPRISVEKLHEILPD
ncbi:hypothetical protein O181_005678 [Austropuccinia psidii MF-1]|uniref:Uncharacterized protein n=1 Tax=Austropuccinia psidii MF-1 TaxID=1389203 RepID=A0A9Q3BIQ4_9BASI|nr:hypothetical protein [Austropuccinia psidii MF-1]